MNYKIIATSVFERQLKRLNKKYPSLKKEIQDLYQQLLRQPDLGTPIGSNSYKIRLAVQSKGRGKRGGMRIITHIELDFIVQGLTNIYLLTIYDKSETITISKSELKYLLNSKDNKNE